MKILSRKTRIIIGVSLLVLSLMMILCFIKFGSLMAFLFIYPYALAEIAGFGINPFLAEILAVVIAIVFLGIIGLIFSWKKERRTAGICLLATLFILHTLALFFVSRERFFDLEGQPLKYCSRDLVTGELDCADAPGYDKYRQKRHAITSEEAKELEVKRISENSEVSMSAGEIPCWEVKSWFNAKTGEPLIYYENDVQENFHCHVQPDFSTISGKELTPVDAESVAKIKVFSEKKYSEIEQQQKKEESENEIKASNSTTKIISNIFSAIEGALADLYRNFTVRILFIIFLNLSPWIVVLVYEKKSAHIVNSKTLMLIIIMAIICLNVGFCSSISDYSAVSDIFYVISLVLFASFCLSWFVGFNVIRKKSPPLNNRRCVPPETFLS